MRLGLKGRIAKIFNEVFVGGVSDAAWRGQNSTVIKDVSGRLDASAHTVFIISQSHSVEQGLQPFKYVAQLLNRGSIARRLYNVSNVTALAHAPS